MPSFTDWIAVAYDRPAISAATANGRVNGIARFRAGSMSMADSVDGNKLKYGYDENIRYVLAWLDQTECQPHLSLFGGAA